MRKALVIILLIIQFSCAKQPQDRLNLKIQYQPGTRYEYASDQTLQTVIKYTGKRKALQNLKSRGIQNPTVIHKKSSTKGIITTGKLEEDIAFPVKAECLMTVENNGQKESAVSVTFHGKCHKDSLPYFDTAIAENADKKYKMILLQSWQKSISQLSFNGELLKIGEELTIENPLSIPMEGSEIEMIIRTDFKLLGITGNMANFDISQHYSMSPKLMDNSFKGKGNGKGQLVYDIENKTPLSYEIHTEMDLCKKLDSFDFELKTKSALVQTIRMSPK